jgi:hypothetical protein
MTGTEIGVIDAHACERVQVRDTEISYPDTGRGDHLREASPSRGDGRISRTAATSPLMVNAANNPGGLLKAVFDGFQAQVAANRAWSIVNASFKLQQRNSG